MNKSRSALGSIVSLAVLLSNDCTASDSKRGLHIGFGRHLGEASAIVGFNAQEPIYNSVGLFIVSGLGFSTTYTVLNVVPAVGYRFSQDFASFVSLDLEIAGRRDSAFLIFGSGAKAKFGTGLGVKWATDLPIAILGRVFSTFSHDLGWQLGGQLLLSYQL